MNYKVKVLYSNTLIFAIGNILTKFIMFFLMPLYTGFLTTAQYGVAELINNLIEVVVPIATLCISDAVFRFSLDEDANYPQIFTTAFGVLLQSYLLLLVLCVGYYHVSGYEYTFYFYLLYVATTVRSLCSQFARGLGHVIRFAVSGVINALVLVLMSVILLIFWKAGIKGYLAALIIAHFVAGLFSFLASGEYRYLKHFAFNKSLLKKMLLFSVPNIPNMLSWWINNISSRYIILAYCGAGVAGLFTAAGKLPAMIHLLTTIFQQAWQYSSAKEIGNKDSNLFFSGVFKSVATFVILVCSALILCTPLIAKFILQGDFYAAWVYVPLLLLAATVGWFTTYFGTFYTAVKNNMMAMISTGIGAGISLLLSLLLIPGLGVYGALVANLVGYVVITLIRFYDTQKYVKITANYPLILFQLGVLLSQAVIMAFDKPVATVFSVGCFLLLVFINKEFFVSLLHLASKMFTIYKRKRLNRE